VPKTIYVPTGEFRKPQHNEFFAPPLIDHFGRGGEWCDCHRLAIDGVIVEVCYLRELEAEAEIYVPVVINT
jgi:hypothetical protein